MATGQRWPALETCLDSKSFHQVWNSPLSSNSFNAWIVNKALVWCKFQVKCFPFEHKSDGHAPRVLTPGRAQKLVAKTFLLPLKSGTLLLIIFENKLTETECRTKRSRELQTVYRAVIHQLIMQSSGFLSGCLVTIQNSYTASHYMTSTTNHTNQLWCFTYPWHIFHMYI